MTRNRWKIIVVIGLAGVLSANLAFCQTALSTPPKTEPGKILGLLPVKGFSLLDPSRLRITNSYSFSFLSSGKYSGTMGIYQTSIGYQVSNPLYLQVDVGYLHQPFRTKNNLDLNGRIFPNFFLLYNPGDNFSFSVNLITGPSNLYNHYWYQEER